MRQIRRVVPLVGALVLLAFGESQKVSAQCEIWQSISDMNGNVSALTIYDGKLIAGGGFTIAGGQPANRVASWNGSSWEPLGVGINGPVTSLTVFNGELIAGGGFSSAGGVPVNNLARWNGSTWQPLGSGPDGANGTIYSLGVYGNELIAGGNFTQAGGAATKGVARWDGTILQQSWRPLGGSGPSGGVDGSCFVVRALAVHNDELAVGGCFTVAGGQPANGIAVWDGSNWQTLGNGFPGGSIQALIVHDADLIAGGSLGFGNNEPRRWDGRAWHTIGFGFDWEVRAFTIFDGQLVVAGEFNTADGNSANRKITRWDGSTWQPFGSGLNGQGLAVSSYDNQLIAAGSSIMPGVMIARWYAASDVPDSAWQAQFGGPFDQPSNWTSEVPHPCINAVFDSNAPGMSPGYTVFCFSDAFSSSLRVLSDRDVNIALFNRDYVTFDSNPENSPAIVVGDLPDLDARLTISNNGAAMHGLSGFDASIGHGTNSVGRLTIKNPNGAIGTTTAFSCANELFVGNEGSGELVLTADPGNFVVADISGDITMGNEVDSFGLVRLAGNGITVDFAGKSIDEVANLTIGNAGLAALEITQGADLIGGSFIEDVVLGFAPGSSSEVTLDGPGSTWSLSSSSFIVGDAGIASLVVSNSGTLGTQSNGTSQVGLGVNPESSCDVTLDGAGSTWSASSNSFIVGDGGQVWLSITDGATLTTSTLGPLILAAQTGSTADITIAGTNSKWTETFAQMFVAGAGDATLTVCDGGSLQFPNVAILPGGTISGDGALLTDVLNFGEVSPGCVQGADPHPTGAGSVGTLTIDGNYRQIGPPPQGDFDESGSLFIEVNSNGGVPVADRLDVTGVAELGGGLFVDVDAELELDVATQLTILTASSIPASHGTMDVAFLPALSDNTKFLKVNYGQNILGFAGSDAVTLSIDSLDSLLDFSSSNAGVDGAPTAAVVADFNQDQLDDLAVTVNDDAGPDFLFVLTNNPAGGFDADQYAVGVHPAAIVAGDFDLKPGIDLAIANQGDGAVQLLANSGTGVFSNAGDPIVVGNAPIAIAAANLNGQPGDDLALAFNGSNFVKVFFFPFLPSQIPVSLPAGTQPVQIDPSDVDVDRPVAEFADLVVLNRDSNNVSVFINNGNNTFTAVAPIGVGERPIDLIVADANGDLYPEIMTANRPLSGLGGVSVVRNTTNDPMNFGPSPTFAPAVNIETELPPRAVVAANFDVISDGDLDLGLLLDDGDTAKVQVLRNDTDEKTPSTIVLAPVTDPPPQTVPAGALTMLVGDLDDDSQRVVDDLIVINQNPPSPLAGGGTSSNLATLFNATKPIPDATPCPADIAPIGGNGLVNVDDLLLVINSWGSCQNCAADIAPIEIGGNGVVNVDDLLAVINAWGACAE